MKCSDLAADLSAYVDGELSSARRAAVERHVESCAACARAVAQLRALQALLREVPEVDIPRAIEWRQAARTAPGITWDCDTVRPQLSALLDGELSRQAADSLLGHLDVCSECLREYALLQRMVGLLSAIPRVAAPGDLRERIWARIRADQAATAKLPRRWRRWAAAAVGTAAAAGLLFAVMGRRPQQTAPEIALGPPPPAKVAAPAPTTPTPPRPSVTAAKRPTTPAAGKAVGPSAAPVASAGRGARRSLRALRPAGRGPLPTRESVRTVAVRPETGAPRPLPRLVPRAQPVETPPAEAVLMAATRAAPRDVELPAAAALAAPPATSLLAETPKPKPVTDVVTPGPRSRPVMLASADIGALQPVPDRPRSNRPRAPRASKAAPNGVLLSVVSPEEAKAKLERNAAAVAAAHGASAGSSASGGLQF